MNQILLSGRVRSIKKIKGTIHSFHIDINRDSESSRVDSPIINLSSELSLAVATFLVENAIVSVRAHIETTIRGGYGTVTMIVADEINI